MSDQAFWYFPHRLSKFCKILQQTIEFILLLKFRSQNQCDILYPRFYKCIHINFFLCLCLRNSLTFETFLGLSYIRVELPELFAVVSLSPREFLQVFISSSPRNLETKSTIYNRLGKWQKFCIILRVSNHYRLNCFNGFLSFFFILVFRKLYFGKNYLTLQRITTNFQYGGWWGFEGSNNQNI